MGGKFIDFVRQGIEERLFLGGIFQLAKKRRRIDLVVEEPSRATDLNLFEKEKRLDQSIIFDEWRLK
jgi:hypothetical protein